MVHPFIDGNGRTARLLLNLELMKFGYPPIVIPKEVRAQYYDALDQAHIKEDYSGFLALVEGELNKTLDLYMKLLNINL